MCAEDGDPSMVTCFLIALLGDWLLSEQPSVLWSALIPPSWEGRNRLCLPTMSVQFILMHTSNVLLNFCLGFPSIALFFYQERCLYCLLILPVLGRPHSLLHVRCRQSGTRQTGCFHMSPRIKSSGRMGLSQKFKIHYEVDQETESKGTVLPWPFGTSSCPCYLCMPSNAVGFLWRFVSSLYAIDFSECP